MYQQVLEQLPQTAIVVFDRELRFNLVAGPALSDAGLERAKVEGRLLGDVVPSPVREQLEVQYRRALAGESVSLRYRSMINGRMFWLRILPLRTADGDIETAMAVTLDVTEQAEAEQRVQETVSALDEAQRIAHVGSWSWDPAVGRAVCSAEVYRILGRDPAEGPLTGEVLLGLLEAEDRQHLLASLVAQLGQGVAGGREFRLQTRIRRFGDSGDSGDSGDGTVSWLQLTGRGGADADSPLVGTVQDVTELRRAEVEATHQRDYVQAIITASEEGILLSEEGTIVDVNPAMCRLIGYSRAELIGLSPPYPFWADREVTELQGHLIGTTTTKLSAGIESIFRRKDGRELPVAITTVIAEHNVAEAITAVSTVRDISVQKHHEAKLERLATRDPLTGLFNQRAFRDHLRQALLHSRRYDRPLSLALLDLDYFKLVNDLHGHPAGDRVLRETARRLRNMVRGGESISRIGGEEFGWILPNTTETDAHQAAERARQTIAAVSFPVVGHISLSIGVCELDAVSDADELYANADLALYRAKESGRNRTVRFSAG
jgi:diguanylate cyclase (GGDEF)-like protein/PAS domain S-box-containing protein